MPFGPIVQRRTPTLFAGRLRQKINIVSTSSAQDTTGGQSLAVTTTFAENIWASIEALSGVEKFAAHEFVSEVSHQVVIRYLAGVTSAMQVVFQDRQFQIHAVLNPDERKKFLILMCNEVNDSLQINPA